MCAYTGRVSRLASSCPKDFDFEYFVYSNEADYNIWCSFKRIIFALRQIENNTLWNILMCILGLSTLILVAADYSDVYTIALDAVFNVIYAFHVAVTTFERLRQAQYEDFEFKWWMKVALIVDIASFLHYAGLFLEHDTHRIIKITCYFLRLQTSFRFLWTMTDSNLNGSVIGTALKYCFIFLVIRLFYSLLWMHIPIFQNNWVEAEYEITDLLSPTIQRSLNVSRVQLVSGFNVTDDSTTSKFIRCAYLVNMMFLPIGPMGHPKNDYERIALLFVVITGSFVVTGAAVASLSLVISLYLRPEEEFRARFRLIMDEMKNTHVPLELRDKVYTFYHMYWHKQKAISETELLPIFPHTIPSTIYTDIYFEAQQKSPILRDLSYQFLWEVAKVMETTHYIPGDAIIKRDSFKSSIIYITYGDVEMLTAEDDQTAILRMTRGTVISPCAGCPSMACARSLVKIQAATFCTAQVLTAANLWRVARKYGKLNGQAFIILSSFEEHFERVKRQYKGKTIQPVKYKSSILQFKRNLMALKEAKEEDGSYLLERTDFFLEISECYIMRNRADSSLTEEADEICLRPTFPCILQPQSSLLVAWHIVVSILILIISFTHPYNLMYLENVDMEFRFFDYMATTIFSLDLIVHLSTGANVEEGVPINFKQTSTQQMRSYWFLLDVLGTIPFFEFIGDGRFAGLNKLLRLPKLFHTLKSMEDVCVYHSNILRFMSYSLLMFILCFLIASLQQGYMCYVHQHCRVKNLTHPPFWKKDALTDHVTHRMFFGLYWAISIITFTTHSTSNWNTSDWRNLVYTTVLLESVAILYTFMEAMYSATMMVSTALKEDYDQTIANVKHFLISNYVDSTLRHRFIRYLQLCWYTDKAYSMTQRKESIFYDLPPHVYQDIVAKQRIKYLLCVPFMKYVNKEDYKAISSASHLFYTSPNEILLNTGDINNEIFVIKQGICEVYDPETEKVIDRLHHKHSFGVLECLLRFPAYFTVRAVTHVQIFTISRRCLANALCVPRIQDAIEYVKRHPHYLDVQRRHEPFLSYEDPPITPNLAKFPLPRKFEPDTAFLQPFMNLGFFSILRYVFPRCTIRPDGTYIYRYEWFRAVCALTSSLMYPSYSYMVLQFPWLYNFLYFLDFCAYFDTVQRMMVAYYNERGILVYHPASTAANYIKGAFLVDLLASLPMESLEYSRSHEIVSSDSAIETVSVCKQLLMLNRLLQLYRVPGAMDILSQYIPREDIILVIKSIPLFMILLNVLTCFVVFASVNILIPPTDTSLVSWKGWKIVPHNDIGGSWINLFSDTYRFNMTESPWNLQLTIYSWVINEISTTGFNTFQPSNLDLLSILVFGMCVGCMMKTYFSVRIISIRANVNKMLANFQESMKDISMYMTKEKLSPHVQAKVLAYYEYNWNKTGGLNYRNVLKLCDQITLRTDAILHLYGHTFNKCPLLYHCDISLLRVVGRSIHGVNFLAGTRIIQKDDVITDMYIVDYGTLDVKESKESLQAYANLVRGSVFGNMENQESVRCPTDVITTSNVHLLQIKAKVFHTIIVDFPTIKLLMRKYRPKNENYILGRFGESSSSLTDWKQLRRTSSTKLNVNFEGIAKHFNINSSPAQYYLILISLLCVYGDIYNAGFQFNHVAMIACLYILDMCFYMKIIFHYILPFVVGEGEARAELIDARKEYLKGEFKYDIVSCLPIECFCFLFKTTEDKWRWLSILRLNRLLRIATIYGCLTRHFAKLSINLTVSTVIMTLIWFSLFVHGMACIWYSIGVMEDNVLKGSSWLHKNDGTDVCDNAYICSIYFILTTFIEKGVGDVIPQKQSEVVFTIIFELISTMIFMIYVGEFSNIFQYQSFRSFAYYRKHLELQDFLNNNRVSKNLVSLVKKYSLHLWRESRGVQMPDFLEKAPPCFKLKIMSAAYMKHFVDHPAFKDCEPAFLRQLVGCLQLYTYSPEIYVAKEGEITNSMYLVHRGTVHELDEEMDQKLAQFNSGQSFGMVHGLMRDLPFNFSYKTVKKSEVLTLNLDSWEHLLRLFPKSRYEIFKNVPNHPYGKPPDDKGQQRVESIKKTPPFISQPSPRTSPRRPSESIEVPKEQSNLSRLIKPAAAAADVGSGAAVSTAGTAATVSVAAGVTAAASMEAESVEKEDFFSMGVLDAEFTSTTTLPSFKEQKNEITASEVTSSIRGLTATPATQDQSAAISNVDLPSVISTSKSSKKVYDSKQERTASKIFSNLPLKLDEEPPVEISSSSWPLNSRRQSDDNTKDLKAETEAKKQEDKSALIIPTVTKISEGTLKTISAPRQPFQYPSHPNLDVLENASTSTKNASKSIQTIESKYFDKNDLDKPDSQTNFFRRLTINAKKLIGKDKKDKDSLQIEQDIKVTSELWDKYKEKAVKQNEKSLLSQYIEKLEAKNAAETQSNVQDDEKLPTRSVVAFGDDEQDDIATASIAPRRSVVVFGDRKFPEKRENKKYDQTEEKVISQTPAAPRVTVEINKEKEIDGTTTSDHSSSSQRPALPLVLKKDDDFNEKDLSDFPYLMQNKESDDEIILKPSKSKIMKDNGEYDDKLKARSGKSVVGIIEPQTELMDDKSVDLWKPKNESEEKSDETIQTKLLFNNVSKTREISDDQIKSIFSSNENTNKKSNGQVQNESKAISVPESSQIKLFHQNNENYEKILTEKLKSDSYDENTDEEISVYSHQKDLLNRVEESQSFIDRLHHSELIESDTIKVDKYIPASTKQNVPPAEFESKDDLERPSASVPEQKPAKITLIPETEIPQSSKGVLRHDKAKDKKASELSLATDELLFNDTSRGTLEEYLYQTHKSKSKPTVHDKVVMKRKTEAEKRMEKRMTKVRYEGDGGQETGGPRLSNSVGKDPEPPEDDLRTMSLQLPLSSLQQLMDSDEASTKPAVRDRANPPPPPD